MKFIGLLLFSALLALCSAGPTKAPSVRNRRELSHCGDVVKKVYLDIVAVIDQSESMGAEGTDEFLAFLQSAVARLTVSTPGSAKSEFYTRVAVLQYNDKTANVVYDFSDDDENIYNIALDKDHFTVTADLDNAISKANELFLQNALPERADVRRVIIAGISAFDNSVVYKSADQFKAQNDIIVIYNYVQGQQAENAENLKKFASPGYYLDKATVQADTVAVIDELFLNLCCYCGKSGTALYQTYSIEGTDPRGRGIASGGCYHNISAPAAWVAARNACLKEGGDLASVYDEYKDDFLLALFPTKTKYWLGYIYNSATRDFEWSDGSSSSPYFIFPWASGQPGRGDATYAQQTTGLYSQWYTSNSQSGGIFDYPCEFQPCSPAHYCT